MRSFVLPLLAASAFLVRPARAQTQFEVLVVAVPEKYHRDCIPVARESFEKMALHHQFGLTWSTDAAVLDGDLKKYAAIVFLNTPSEELNEACRQRFQDYIHAGGGFVGVHMGIATKREWPCMSNSSDARFESILTFRRPCCTSPIGIFPQRCPCLTVGSGPTNGMNSTPRWSPISMWS